MIALDVTFDLGRYHATPWGAHVNEARVEWPPSSWRILRALLAASYAHADVVPRRPDLEAALVALGQGLPRYRIPESEPAHTRHYFPLPGWSPTKSGETSLVIDAFHAVRPEDVLRVAWDVELAPTERAALALAAQAVGSLGRSEAVCTMRLVDDGLDAEDAHAVPVGEGHPTPRWAAGGEVQDVWSVDPQVDVLAGLGTSVTEMRNRRELVPRGSRRVSYLVRAPDAQPVVEVPGGVRPTIAHLRLVHPARPALTEAATVAALCRSALQRRYAAVLEDGRSAIFSGHGPDGSASTSQHQHAHYLVGSDPGVPRSDHLWVWAPAGFGLSEVAALAALHELRLREVPEPVRVALVALGTAETLELPGLVGPSRRWRSATPFLMTRHPKRRGGRTVDGPEDQIRRELAHRGLPEPETIALVPGRWMDFTRTRPGGAMRTAHQAIGAELTFPQAVAGPLALGGLSHFGLGRFTPVP